MNAQSKISAEHIADPVDVHVGSRVRLLRKARGMSQEDLAKGLGLTFQQVQKYERGFNRISASKLFAIGHVLGAGIPFFFEGLSQPEAADGADPLHDRAITVALCEPKIRRIVSELGRLGPDQIDAIAAVTKALVELSL
jgi:transcriptional regulator with XRE-family HTH domain